MIHSFEYCQKKVGDIGQVVAVKGAVATVTGLKGGGPGQGIAFADGSKGMIESILGDRTQVIVFSRDSVELGLKVARTGQPLHVTVGRGLLGHTISALGYLLDKGKEASPDVEPEIIQAQPWRVAQRQKIKKQLLTGIAVTDLVLPLGEGQRQLVIGNKKTGKTDWVLRVVAQQAKLGKICVYGLLGKRQAEIARIEQYLSSKEVREQVVLVAAPAGSAAAEIYIAPLTVMAIAEHFRDLGQDSLVVLDDLTTHAKYYRELDLLAGHFPGRDSYPGEIFYTHAHLLERAGNFMVDGQAVSLTALPMAESQAGDLTGYIETNLMSMTDGHLFFAEDMFLQGLRPAIDVFLSVTRVGRQTQNQLLHELGQEVVECLQQSQELQRYLKFGAEMTDQVKQSLQRGEALRRLFTQVEDEVLPLELTAILVGLILLGRFDGRGVLEWLELWHENQLFQDKLKGLIKQSKTKKDLLEVLAKEEEFEKE